MNIQKDLSQLEAFRNSDVKIPTEEDICKSLLQWMKNEIRTKRIEDVFPFMKNISEAAQNRFRLYLIFLLIPLSHENKTRAMFSIAKYRDVKDVIGL